MANPITILGLAGSLRRASWNRAALRAAQQLVPAGTTLEILDLDGLPVFNEDEETPLPAKVVELKSRVRTADAVLFATPEYNGSVPAGLKNALEWGSRPGGDSAWSGKPVAVMGASPGLLGTVRAQAHLRQILGSLNMHLVNQPEALIARAHERFDAGGNLTDEKTRAIIAKLLSSLVDWTRRLRQAG